MNITYHLALGSNQGERLQHLLNGLRYLGRHGTILTHSSVYITKPIDMPGPCTDFFNMVAEYESELTPRRLLCLCKAIERRCDRPRDSHNLPRTLDIDILLAGECRLCTPQLTIPHPKIHTRSFVLAPLLEMNSSLRDPVSGTPYTAFLNAIGQDDVLDRFQLPVNRISDS